MEVYVKNLSDCHVFFCFSIMILSYAYLLPMSQLQTQQLMTSRIKSHIEYLMRTYHILMLIL